VAIHRAPGNPVTTYSVYGNSSNISFNLNQVPTPGNILSYHILFSCNPSSPTIGNPVISGCTFTSRYSIGNASQTGTFVVGASPTTGVSISVSGGTCDFAVVIVEYTNFTTVSDDAVGLAVNSYQYTNPVHIAIPTLSQAQEVAWAAWYCFGTAFSGWGTTPSGWNVLLQTVNASGWSVTVLEQLTTVTTSQNISLQANGTINTSISAGGSGYYVTLQGTVAPDPASPTSSFAIGAMMMQAFNAGIIQR
jgi:hypothetical protein